MLTKLRCRDYYKLFQDKMKNETIPTAVKAWSKRFLNQSQDWNKSFENIYHTTADNKSRKFTFKLLHRILVTNKEIKRFKLKNEDLCSQYRRADSLEHTFLDCPVNIKFYEEIISWFNQKNKTKITLSNDELLFKIISSLRPSLHTQDANLIFSSSLPKNISMHVNLLTHARIILSLLLNFKINGKSNI